MSNRIDFFQSSQTKLSLPSATISIWVDGELCPYLKTVEIVRGSWPGFGRARLIYNCCAYPDNALEPEKIESKVPIGKSVCIVQIYNRLAPAISATALPIFYGQIEGYETRLGSGEERIDVIVRDFSASLKRVTVYGRHVAGTDGSILFLPSIDTTFNENGKGNAAVESAENKGLQHTVFCSEPSKGKHWSYAEVIDYLLCEYVPAGRLQRPELGQLKALTGEQIVSDLDVTGLNLIEALHRCCKRVGLDFKFVPCLDEACPHEAIIFYRNGEGRAVELNYQQRKDTLSISKTNVTRLRSKKNFWPVTHKYIGQGDFKVYEATFDLIKAWDSGLEDTQYDKFAPSTNPDFYKVKEVYRKWCLNEAGDYTDSPYNRGEAFDFSKIFGRDKFAPRHRRFWPTLTNDKQGKSLGYYLQVSFDSGVHWWQYLYAFNNLLDECGIWLSSDQIDVQAWVAALKGALRFRITASVISDERLSCKVADGPVGSTISVVKQLITRPREFKFRQVSDRSIFWKSSDESLGTADEVDDSAKLYQFVRGKAGVGAEEIEAIRVQTPHLIFDYQLGDRITCSPESRDVFGIRSDSWSTFWIKHVHMDFKNQCTNLDIIRQRKVLV